MNDRERFEAWWKSSGYIGTEDTYRAFLAGAELKQSELDKARARIAQLEAEQDKRFNDFEHDCQIEVEGLNVRIAQLESTLKDANEDTKLFVGHAGRYYNVLVESTDTWLSQHDKSVELKLLEHIVLVSNSRADCGEVVLKMLASRK